MSIFLEILIFSAKKNCRKNLVYKFNSLKNCSKSIFAKPLECPPSTSANTFPLDISDNEGKTKALADYVDGHFLFGIPLW